MHVPKDLPALLTDLEDRATFTTIFIVSSRDTTAFLRGCAFERHDKKVTRKIVCWEPCLKASLLSPSIPKWLVNSREIRKPSCDSVSLTLEILLRFSSALAFSLDQCVHAKKSFVKGDFDRYSWKKTYVFIARNSTEANIISTVAVLNLFNRISFVLKKTLAKRVPLNS